MAYTQVQTLVDTDRRYLTKRVNSANTETAALVANAAALNHAMVAVTTVASANDFMVGESIASSGGGTAIVQNVINSTSIMLSNVSGTFAGTNTLTGNTTGKVRTQSGAVAPETYSLHVGRIVYDIWGAAGAAKVTLEWEGTGGGANNRTIAILSGCGVLELDTHGMRANNTANSPTGNILISTTNWEANSHYTLIVDISKVGGYAAPYLERNQTLGYGGSI